MDLKKGINRNLISIIILMIFTFGIYYFYWVYQVTYEIKDLTNDENLKPEKETLLNIIPFYPILWLNKIGKIVYLQIPSIIGEKDIKDGTNTLVIFGLFNSILLIINPITLIFVVWSIGILIFPTISVIILQNRLNSIWNKIEEKNEVNNGIIPINKIIFSQIITLGFYNLYWIYCTVKNIREVTKINRLSPGLEVILNIFIPFYNIFWIYRYGTIIYKDLAYKLNIDEIEDKTNFLLIINLIESIFVFIIAAISANIAYGILLSIFVINIIISIITSTTLQEKLNSIFEKENNKAFD